MASSSTVSTESPCLPNQFNKAFNELDNLLSIQLSPQQAAKAKRQLDLLQSEHSRQLERVAELEAALGVLPKTKKIKRNPTIRAAAAPPFATLPDLCLLALFRQLPYFAQLTAVQVCTRWSRLVPVINRTRTSLTLHIGLGSNASLREKDYWFWGWLPTSRPSVTHLVDESGRKQFPNWQETEWNTLRLTDLSSITVDHICTVFSNLEHLTIRLDNTTSTASTIDNLLLLLKRHQKTLLSLNLTEHYPLSTPVTIEQIYTTLNSLSTLQRLTLSFNYWPLEDLPLLRQLEHFNFRYSGTKLTSFQGHLRLSTHIVFLRMLSQYGASNDRLISISYFNLTGLPRGESFPQLFTSQLTPSLCARFNLLKISMFYDLAPLCTYFPSLTSLDFTWDRYGNAGQSLSYLLLQLTYLPKLYYFCLTIALELVKVPDSDKPLPQLPSIRAFDLRPSSRIEKISMSSHQQLQLFNLPWTMPNLEVFSFYFGTTLRDSRSRCIDCGVVNFDINWLQGHQARRLEKARRCTRRLFEPLKAQCRRLRVILHDREEILGSAQKLLAEAEGARKFVEFFEM